MVNPTESKGFAPRFFQKVSDTVSDTYLIPVLLIFSLALPNPAFAMRQVGLEETGDNPNSPKMQLVSALGGVPSTVASNGNRGRFPGGVYAPEVAAGLEERKEEGRRLAKDVAIGELKVGGILSFFPIPEHSRSVYKIVSIDVGKGTVTAEKLQGPSIVDPPFQQMLLHRDETIIIDWNVLQREAGNREFYRPPPSGTTGLEEGSDLTPKEAQRAFEQILSSYIKTRKAISVVRISLSGFPLEVLAPYELKATEILPGLQSPGQPGDVRRWLIAFLDKLSPDVRLRWERPDVAELEGGTHQLSIQLSYLPEAVAVQEHHEELSYDLPLQENDLKPPNYDEIKRIPGAVVVEIPGQVYQKMWATLREHPYHIFIGKGTFTREGDYHRFIVDEGSLKRIHEGASRREQIEIGENEERFEIGFTDYFLNRPDAYRAWQFVTVMEEPEGPGFVSIGLGSGEEVGMWTGFVRRWEEGEGKKKEGHFYPIFALRGPKSILPPEGEVWDPFPKPPPPMTVTKWQSKEPWTIQRRAGELKAGASLRHPVVLGQSAFLISSRWGPEILILVGADGQIYIDGKRQIYSIPSLGNEKWIELGTPQEQLRPLSPAGLPLQGFYSSEVAGYLDIELRGQTVFWKLRSIKEGLDYVIVEQLHPTTGLEEVQKSGLEEPKERDRKKKREKEGLSYYERWGLSTDDLHNLEELESRRTAYHGPTNDDLYNPPSEPSPSTGPTTDDLYREMYESQSDEESSGLEERVPEWLAPVLKPEQLPAIVRAVHPGAKVAQKVAVLFDRKLLPKDSEFNLTVELVGLAAGLKGAFAWDDVDSLQFGLLSEQQSYQDQGYRVIQVRPRTEGLPSLPWEAVPVVAAQAIGLPFNIFLVDTTPYLNLKARTWDDIRATLTELFA